MHKSVDIAILQAYIAHINNANGVREMQTFENKADAKKYAIEKYSADYVEFQIAAIQKLTDLMCKSFNIPMKEAGKYYISLEFKDIYGY